ncbi:MAG TPA: glycerol-3-phosphate 1-O-acyltransferase PlsY [Pyrinomonadaceae bacterium]|nr:glycerol-3-phosphate 1-O-acyltransferase PlsY [Pyrinomonadaceae bacterium]
MLSLLVLPIAYLIGSIPFGYLIVKLTSGSDIRQTGSGGTGATNVSRRAGKLAGVATLLLDALKGALAVFVATKWYDWFQPDPLIANWIVPGAAVAAIVGHIFPVWLKFRGGKGVATGAGTFLFLAPLALLCAAFVFLAVVLLSRYVSLGSILAAGTIPFFMLLTGATVPELVCAVAGAFLIIFAHRANIERIISGTESKFS